MMKVLLISSQFPPLPGGGGTYSFYLATALAGNGFPTGPCDVKVITASETQGHNTIEKRKKNLEFHRGVFDRSGRVPYEATIRYALNLCRSFRPTIIHGQHFDGAYIASQLKVAFPQAFTVATFHKSPSGLQVAEQRHIDPQMIALQSYMPWLDKLIATCTTYRREFLEVGVSPEKVALIWPGINCARLVSTAAGTKSRVDAQLKELGLYRHQYDHIILCPARVDPTKDLETLVRAAGEIKRRFSKSGRAIAFLVAGRSRSPDQSENSYLEYLSMMAVHEGIEKQLFFGSFSLTDMFGLYKLCDLAVLPSVREALGLVLLESLALKLPTIVANVPGVSDIISSETNGLVFPSRDHKLLANQIERILNDQQLRDSLIHMGSLTVQHRFTESQMATEHLRVYSAIKTQKGCRSSLPENTV